MSEKAMASRWKQSSWLGHFIRQDNHGGFKELQEAIRALGEKECCEKGWDEGGKLEEKTAFMEKKEIDHGLRLEQQQKIEF